MKTFIDLFCGVGGFHIPLAQRGLKCVFASEIDERAAKAYEDNFGLKPHGDITKIDTATIPPHDVLCAGFPCQPFSNSGNGLGLKDARGGLFHEIVRIATDCQPKVLLLENVPEILTIDRGDVLATIWDALDDAGYHLHYSVLNAGHYGVPQARIRVYFVCIRKDLSLTFTPPKPLPMSAQKCVNDILLPYDETKHLIMNRDDFYFDKRTENRRVYKLHQIGGIRPNRQGEKIYNPGGPAPTQSASCGRPTGMFAMDDPPPKQTSAQGNRLYHGQGLATTTTADGGGKGGSGGLYLVTEKPAKRAQQAGRIYSPTEVARTMMSGGGGGGANTGLYLVGQHVRTLHIDEVKQVMGFDKSHIVSKGKQGFRQMGNAVIPAMVGFVYDGIK